MKMLIPENGKLAATLSHWSIMSFPHAQYTHCFASGSDVSFYYFIVSKSRFLASKSGPGVISYAPGKQFLSILFVSPPTST